MTKQCTRVGDGAAFSIETHPRQLSWLLPLPDGDDSNVKSFRPFGQYGFIAAALRSTTSVTGCYPDPPQHQHTALPPRDDDPTAGVPERYHFLYSGGINDQTDNVWEGPPFTKLELERTECFGTCPSYIVSFSADWTARYNGSEYAERTGAFNGEAEIGDYGQIWLFIDKFKIFSAARKYKANWTDSTTAIVRATLRKTNETIEISDYRSQGPVELWALFNAMDAAFNRVEWTPDPK